MDNYDHADYTFKIVLTGDSDVGKSHILTKYVDGVFINSYSNTIGVDFRLKKITIDKKKIKLQIWDTAGHERFRTISRSYYRGANAIIIAFSLTSSESFNNIKRWLLETEISNCYKILVGNKHDVNIQVINFDEINKICNKYNLIYFSVSAKSGENISEIFEFITKKLIVDFKPIEVPNDIVNLNQKNKFSCCFKF